MTTITIRIPNELDNSLAAIAKPMRRSKSFIVREAIEQYVIKTQEDLDDLQGALEALKDNGPRYTLEEVIKDLGLENEMEN